MPEWLKVSLGSVACIACVCLIIFAVSKAANEFFYELAFMGIVGLGKLLLMARNLALGKRKRQPLDKKPRRSDCGRHERRGSLRAG